MVIGREQIGVMVAVLLMGVVGVGTVSVGHDGAGTTLLGESQGGGALNGGKVVARIPQERPVPSEDLVAGYHAFVAGDYDAALRHYEMALSQAADPGLVA